MRWTWPLNARASNGQRKKRNCSDANRARPDFMCIGVHKGGTTWFYQQLYGNPVFWMHSLKELHYLDQLSRVQRSSSPRCRDERDRCFLEGINRLSAEPSLHLGQDAQPCEPQGP